MPPAGDILGAGTPGGAAAGDGRTPCNGAFAAAAPLSALMSSSAHTANSQREIRRKGFLLRPGTRTSGSQAALRGSNRGRNAMRNLMAGLYIDSLVVLGKTKI